MKLKIYCGVSATFCTQLATYSLTILLLLFIAGECTASSYKDTTSKWNSYKDVGTWLESNFVFDKNRSRMIAKRLRKQGPSGLLVRNPEKLFTDSHGYCADAVYFSITILNSIDPTYNARWVFIRNSKGPPHHWVAAFDYKGKLYIMDYGTGAKWQDMQGTHGPFNLLDEYRDFLESLSLPNFKVDTVSFRDMPGAED